MSMHALATAQTQSAQGVPAQSENVPGQSAATHITLLLSHGSDGVEQLMAAYLKKMSQLGVAIRHVRIPGGKCSEDVTQSTQRFVDAAGLLLSLSFDLRPIQPFTARHPLLIHITHK